MAEQHIALVVGVRERAYLILSIRRVNGGQVVVGIMVLDGSERIVNYTDESNILTVIQNKTKA